MKFHALRNSPFICLSFFDYTAIIGKKKAKVNIQTYTLTIQNPYFTKTIF